MRASAAPLREPMRLAVHLAAPNGGAAVGTFVATGLLGDSGTIAPLDRYEALRKETRVPVVVHGAESLGGAAGAIAIGYDGVFRPVAPGVFSGDGAWRVTGGDHAYEELEGEGTWTATAVFGRHGLTIDTVYDGRGELRRSSSTRSMS